MNKLFTLRTGLIAALTASTALLAACGPSPTAVVPGNPSQAKLNAVAVSEISTDGAVSANISLSWDALPSGVQALKFSRRRATETISQYQEIATLNGTSRNTLDDSDPSLVPGVEYVYALRADNQNAVAVASAESNTISVIDAAAIQSFGMSAPAANGETLKDPLGQGHQFSWQDAGTGLYHVQVSDTAGNVLWGAVTKNTTISYGTRSGSEKQGTITTQPDPKLMVPLALTQRLKISSVNPDLARNEVQFKGIGSTGQYRIQVSAIQTLPTKGDLAGARSIAIRKAQEIRFIAQ